MQFFTYHVYSIYVYVTKVREREWYDEKHGKKFCTYRINIFNAQ